MTPRNRKRFDWCRTMHHRLEYRKMRESLNFYDIQGVQRQSFLHAYGDSDWNWTKCDGCTGVDECHFPKGMRFPPCVRHDYDCWLVTQGLTTRQKGDQRFLRNMRAYRVNIIRAWARWAGVRSYWLLWGKWWARSD